MDAVDRIFISHGVDIEAKSEKYNNSLAFYSMAETIAFGMRNDFLHDPCTFHENWVFS